MVQEASSAVYPIFFFFAHEPCIRCTCSRFDQVGYYPQTHSRKDWHNYRAPRPGKHEKYTTGTERGGERLEGCRKILFDEGVEGRRLEDVGIQIGAGLGLGAES